MGITKFIYIYYGLHFKMCKPKIYFMNLKVDHRKL